MPHYADGTEAKVGDIVRGKPYNTPHEVIGPIVSITPGQDACNCQVAFARLVEPQMIYAGQWLAYAQTVADYGETRAFTKIA